MSHKTISYWCDKHDIEKRGVGGEYPYPRYRTAPASTDSSGYVFARTKDDGEEMRVRLHRLLAVAEYGVDAVEGMDVHHKNGIPWDNRPENIELVSHDDHQEIHISERERDEHGNFA